METTHEKLGDAIWDAVVDQLLAFGDATEFTALWIRLEPEIDRWLRSPSFLGRVSDNEEHRREIVVRTWIKLQERDHERVRVFVRTELADSDAPARHTRCWLRRVVKNIGIDYLRGLPEYIRDASDGQPYWRTLDVAHEEATSSGSDPHDHIEAAQLLAFLDERIGEARDGRTREWALYRVVLEMWSAGYASDEIAQACALESSRDADRILGAAKELLRRRFRVQPSSLLPSPRGRRPRFSSAGAAVKRKQVRSSSRGSSRASIASSRPDATATPTSSCNARSSRA